MRARVIQCAKRFRPATVGSFAAVAVVLATVNFSIAPLMGEFGPRDWMAILVYISFGLIAAEGGLIAICGVLGTGHPLVRLPTSAAIGFWLYSYWAAGYAMSFVWSQSYYGVDRCLKQISVGLLCLPAGYLAVQLPLWIVRLGFAWRIERIDPAHVAVHRPLSIRDMMVATGLVGIALAGARAASGIADEQESVFWAGFGIISASLAGISLISTLPAVVATLRVRKPAIGTAVIFVYAITAVVITIVIISWFTAQRVRSWETVGFILVATSLAAGLTTPLLIARRLGYRLSWGRLE